MFFGVFFFSKSLMSFEVLSLATLTMVYTSYSIYAISIVFLIFREILIQ